MKKFDEEFAAYYEIEFERYIWYLYAWTKDKDVSIDIVQETFIRCYIKLKKKKMKNFKAYIHQAMKFARIDWKRKKKAVSLEQLMEDENIRFQPIASTSYEEFERRKELVEESILKSKSLDHLKKYIMLLKLEGLKDKEIVRRVRLVTGSNVKKINNVQVMISRIIKTLKTENTYI